MPYFLTLGPYASYWFALQHEPMQMAPKVTAASDPNAVIAEGLPALLVGADWQTVMDSATRTVLERQALAPFLQRQEWFASRSMDATRPQADALLARRAPWAPADESFSVLLRALMLDKALYELTYEVNNRLEWVRIPRFTCTAGHTSDVSISL